MSREELLQLLKESLSIEINLDYKKSRYDAIPVIAIDIYFDDEKIDSDFIEPGEVRELMRYAS